MATTIPAAPGEDAAAALPPAPEARAASALAPAMAPAMATQRGSRLTRFKAWLRLAYTDLGSKEHHLLLEWIIWMVIVSVVITVLQHDAALDAQYHGLILAAEGFVLIVFATDYALNLYYAPSKRGYAFSFSGVVDLLAILPSFLIFVDLSSIKFLRALRFLRFLRLLQVIKAIRHREHLENEDEQSLILDLQLLVIGISALLLLVPDDALRNMLLACTLVAAITTGVRRWLVYKQRPTLSVLVLVGCVVWAMVYAAALDAAGHLDWAVWFLIGAVLVAAITWSQIEGPAGI